MRPSYARPHWKEIRREQWGPGINDTWDQAVVDRQPLIVSGNKVLPWEEIEGSLDQHMSGKVHEVMVSHNARFRPWNKGEDNQVFTDHGYTYDP